MRLPMSAADQLSGQRYSSDRASLCNASASSYTRNCYRYAWRSVRLTREVARKTAARITRQTLESRMPLTGAAREFLDSQKVAACNRPACGQSCTNATYDAGNDPGEARTGARCDVSAGAEIRKRYQPHRGQPPATYCFNSTSLNLLLLRRCARTIVHLGRALRLCLRLPRHVGRACAHESLHAHRKRQAQAIHCCFG